MLPGPPGEGPGVFVVGAACTVVQLPPARGMAETSKGKTNGAGRTRGVRCPMSDGRGGPGWASSPRLGSGAKSAGSQGLLFLPVCCCNSYRHFIDTAYKDSVGKPLYSHLKEVRVSERFEFFTRRSGRTKGLRSLSFQSEGSLVGC